MSLDDPKLDEVAVFDPNIWYQLSEVRVDQGGKDLTHNLIYEDDPPDFKVYPDDHNYWQFLPVKDSENRFFLRSQKTGTDFHLGTCFNPDETHPAKTGLCMLHADEDAKDQIWETTKWNDGTTGVRFMNIGNGTDFYLDCHKGSPPFMNDDIDTTKYKPAQRWLISSVSDIQQASYQVGDGKPTMTGDDTGPTNDAEAGAQNADDDEGSGLSVGAKAGIGVGVGVAALAVLAAIFLLLRRRKQKSARDGEAAAAAIQSYHAGDESGKYEKVEEAPANPIVEAPTGDTGAREVEGLTPKTPQTAPMELDSTEVPISPATTGRGP